MPAEFWILSPTPSFKLEMQSSLRISLSRIKVYRSKIYVKNAEKFIAPKESISPEVECADAEEKTPEAVEPPSKRIRKHKKLWR